MPVLKVLVAGIDTADSGATIAGVLPHTRSAVLYDPAINSWSAAGSLAAARFAATATLLPNAKVLVAGGRNPSAELSSAVLYDPATNLWSAAGALANARGQHTATLLPDGTVLATGGVVNSNVFVSTAERYDPATNRWSSAGTLATGRYVHTATLLPDQTVLVAGGVGVTIAPSSSERYSRNLGFNNAWRPVASAPASVAPGSSLVLAGTLFTGLSEASGGNASQNSPSNFPIALLQSQGNEQQRFLGSNPLVNWTSTQLTTGAVTGFPAGPAWVTLFVNGIPSVAKSLIALGSHSITAAYAGDANNIASVSSAVIQVVSSTALSVDPPAPTAGQAVMLTAMVRGFSPTGSVQFKDGSTNLGSAVPLSGGIATLSTNALTAGGHSLTAVYLGDVNNVASTSPGVSRTVNKAASSSTLSAILSSPASGATVTLTAAVSGFLPAGSVQFFDGATSLGTVAVNAGLAVLSINTLAVGGHTITASYSGDANNRASTSPAVALTVTAGQVGGGDADIPTLPEWGAILLGLTLLTLGMRRRSQTARL